MTDSSTVKLTTKQACDYLGCSDKTLRRYVNKGLITKYGSHKNVYFEEHDVKVIYNDFHVNKAKHRPDSPKPNDKQVLSEVKVVRKALKKPTESILNETGKNILLSTTKYIEDKGLLNITTKEPILRYAIASQLFEKYQALGIEGDDKFFFDLAKMQGDMIKHYENSLGLTPAALSKIKPIADLEPVKVDPMSALLSEH